MEIGFSKKFAIIAKQAKPVSIIWGFEFSSVINCSLSYELQYLFLAILKRNRIKSKENFQLILTEN